MDNRITGGGAGITSFQLPASNPAPVPAANIAPQEVQDTLPEQAAPVVNNQAAIDFSNEDARIELIKRISAKNFSYPLGDAKLTIYKDKSGQYIAKYTSLRDGSVKQIPEPKLLEDYAIGSSGPVVITDV